MSDDLRDDTESDLTWAAVIAMIPRDGRVKVLDYLCEATREAAECSREAEEAKRRAADLEEEIARLRPPPTRRELLEQRDAIILRAFAELDGPMSRRAKAIASKMADASSLKTCATSQALRSAAEILRLNGGRPLAWRQLLNIADGFRGA